MAPQVMSTGPVDAERVVSAIVLAFSADPSARWVYPDPRHYLTHFPAAVRVFSAQPIAHATCHHMPGSRGAALWLPPGVLPDEEALGGVFHRSVAEPLRSEVFALFERMANSHPTEPHWYLPLIGVDPTCHRRGYGAALMRHALVQCDRDRAPAYLESSNPANIPLYQRHGFEVRGTIQVGSSPPIFPMVRPPA